MACFPTHSMVRTAGPLLRGAMLAELWCAHVVCHPLGFAAQCEARVLQFLEVRRKALTLPRELKLPCDITVPLYLSPGCLQSFALDVRAERAASSH